MAAAGRLMILSDAQGLVDLHAHVYPSLRTPSAREAELGWPRARSAGDQLQVFRGDRLVRTLTESAWDVAARLAEMDADGVRHQVVSPAPFAFLYDAPADLAADFAAHLNDQIAAFCGEAPERLTGFASVPLQDPERAVAELSHVLDRGLAGVEIGTSAGRLLLHDEALSGFFAEAERLGVPIFLHPGPLERLERTGHNGLAFALARPVETEMAIGSLVHGGILERHPGLRVCVSHGGAGIPALLGRWQTGWQRQTPGVRPDSPDPRTLLRRLWADTLTYDPRVLSLVADAFGADHLVLGTDSPFTARESPPGGAVRDAVAAGLLDLGTADWAAVLARNAEAFLRGAEPRQVPDDRSTSHAVTGPSISNV